ncbi:GAF domain-containing protein [Labedaea rhizosphaerae]|uniref:GAF domain-containing protein n=1 Tax=Labedaea rhizosphaerae TaxID=598644 RepID=A0A4R6SBF7_LABRH|nr:GAF domain-containing protein [Labedaea rhizosphaerae]
MELADTLVADFDIIDFLETLAERVVELLDVAACGLLLVDQHGALNLVAASTEQTRMLELFQVQTAEGPCVECFRTGQPIDVPDLAVADTRWPVFAPAARAAGYRAVHALPMQLRSDTIGALNLFSETGSVLSADARQLGQTMANAATIAILHQRAIRHMELVADQLQTALNSRIVIEQAKGVLAERHGVDVDEAFVLLRSHARHHRYKLSDLAMAVIHNEQVIPAP